jgi:hypothetical protein
VYRRGGGEYVGYWTTLDSIDDEIGLRERGYHGGQRAADELRADLERAA